MHGAHLHHLVGGPRGHHPDVHSGPDGALLDPGVDDDSPVSVILAVEDQGLEGGLPVPLGGGDILHDHFQHRMDVDAVFGGDLRSILRGNADDVLHLGLHLRRAGRGQVDLIDDRQHLQPRVDGQIGIGQGLGLHPLAGTTSTAPSQAARLRETS